MFDENASGEMESPLIFPVDTRIQTKYVRQYKLALLILGILCLGLLVTVICGVLFGIGCKKEYQSILPSHHSVHKFIHISDLHLDSFYNPRISKKSFCRKIDPKFNISVHNAAYVANYGRVGCDAPQSLIEALTKNVKSTSEDLKEVEFIILSGDQSAHRMEEYFVNGTAGERVLQAMTTVRFVLDQHLADLPFLPTFGNNDLPGDYRLPPNPKFYAKVMEIWKPYLTKKCKSCLSPMVDVTELPNTFLEGGYYRAVFNTEDRNIVILSLNTNYWALKPYQPRFNPPANASTIAANQMAWLEKQLELAASKKMKVILVGHVPPGIDPYDGEVLWFQNYTKQYLKFVTDTYQHTVIAQLYGHFHKDDFKIQTYKAFDKGSDESKIHHALMIAPGVTPVYANNPSFRIVEINKLSGNILDYVHYYMDLVMATEFGATPWRFDYRFSTEYGLSPTPGGFMQLAQELIDPKDGSQKWNRYIKHRQVHYQNGQYSRFQLFCALRYTTEALYKQCITKYKVPGG